MVPPKACRGYQIRSLQINIWPKGRKQRTGLQGGGFLKGSLLKVGRTLMHGL